MFKVAEISYVHRGIRAVLVMDDPADLFYLKFIRDAEAFAELFHYKVRTAKKIHDRELERPRLQEEQRIRDARILAIFRSLPGNRSRRIRATRRFLVAKEEPITYDGVVAAIARGLAYDRIVKARRIAELTFAGRRVREIARILGIPPATVDRLKRNAPGCPRIDDPHSPPITPQDFPGSQAQDGKGDAQ